MGTCCHDDLEQDPSEIGLVLIQCNEFTPHLWQLDISYMDNLFLTHVDLVNALLYLTTKYNINCCCVISGVICHIVREHNNVVAKSRRVQLPFLSAHTHARTHARSPKPPPHTLRIYYSQTSKRNFLNL